MSIRRTFPLLAVAGVAYFALSIEQAAKRAEAEPSKPVEAGKPAKATKPTLPARPMQELIAEEIAEQIIAASPMVDPADPKARDEASRKLGECERLVEAAGDRILWGGFNPSQGYHPDAYRLVDTTDHTANQLTELNPMVWAKLYLSTFMFKGTYSVKTESPLTIVELDVQFRTGLDAGEYPYPFWHNPNKWTAYVNADKIALVFGSGRLLSALRISPDPVSLKLIKRDWDAQWQWTDAEGNPQPRVALYSYVFSKDNPHVKALDASFRAMESKFREQNCMTCHEPDNRGRINDLLLLNYPNQALVARRSLVAVLERNQMPPGNEIAHEPTGIQDADVLKELVRLARDFEKQADAAFAYEQSHGTSSTAVESVSP